MKGYHHLSLEEREKLHAFKTAGYSLRDVGRLLDRHPGTLSRELARNTKYGRPYLPCRAQRRAERVGQRQRYHAPLKESLIFLYVREHLRDYHWSPETIAGRLPIDYPGYSLHHETIYRYAYGRRQRRMKLWRYLVLHRRRRLKKDGRKVKAYGRLETALPISLRSGVVNQRQSLGNWETDDMEGRKSDRSSLSVTVERRLRLTRLGKLANRIASTKARLLIDQMGKEDPILRGTLTVDRGSENSRHEKITQATGMPVYACNPYHSWEKGTVENTIGRIRRYLPKGLSLDAVSEEYLASLEEQLNSTPRKCLGYLTPNECLGIILEASSTNQCCTSTAN
jgi:IS30 family transposase